MELRVDTYTIKAWWNEQPYVAAFVIFENDKGDRFQMHLQPNRLRELVKILNGWIETEPKIHS